MSSGGGVPDPRQQDLDDPPAPGVTLASHRRPGQFSITQVFGRAGATFRAAPGLIFGLALLVFVPISFLDAAVTEYGHHVVDGDNVGAAVATIAELGDLMVDLFGFAFFGGLLDHLVGRIHHGHEAHRPHELARQISYGRLISASIVFNLVVLFGITFLILPGLVLFTMFAFVGPLINIERVGVVDAFRRSYRISRHYLLGIAVTVTLPFVVEQLADEWVEGLSISHGFWGEVGTGLVMSLVATSVVVMFEVCTAYHLLELESERKGTPGPSHHAAH